MFSAYHTSRLKPSLTPKNILLLCQCTSWKQQTNTALNTYGGGGADGWDKQDFHSVCVLCETKSQCVKFYTDDLLLSLND